VVLLRNIAYILLALLVLPVLAPIAIAGHPDPCNRCHAKIYWDSAGVKHGDLVQDVGGGQNWTHTIYTTEAWERCKECHTGIASTIANTVHNNIGCACHAVIHAPKFEATNAPEWFAWVATRIIAIPTDTSKLLGPEGGKVEIAEGGVTTLPAYKPPTGATVGNLARILLRLPANTPTNYPKIEAGTLTGYLTLEKYFNLTDSFDGGDYPYGSSEMSYGVEVQLITWRYRPTLPYVYIPGVGWLSGWPAKGPTTGGPVILTLGTRDVAPALVGPRSGYAHPFREAWLVCYNCHFVTAEPASAGVLRFVEGFWLIGIPEVVLKLPAHSITREAIARALAPEQVVTEVPEIALDIVKALLTLFAITTGVALVWISRRVGG
jgi:hypothetical protein